MEAIRAKDRATAKKIVRKMEERAKRRAKLKVVETAKPLGAIGDHGGDRKSDQDSKIENGNLISGGNNSAYRVSRLKRDRPELAERIMAGEFKSVSEAERAAGRRPITEIKPTLGMVASAMSWGKIRSKPTNTGIWCELCRIVDIPRIVHWGRNGETTRKKGAVCTLPHSR